MFDTGKRYYLGSLILFIFGLILIITGAARGNATGGLFLIVPFLVVTGPLAGLGVVLIFLSFVVFQFSLFTRVADRPSGPVGTITLNSQGRRKTRDVKGGGIIFIGPIPIIFGDFRSMRYLLPGAVILFILMIIAGILF